MNTGRAHVLDSNTVSSFTYGTEPLTSRIRSHKLKDLLVSTVTVEEVLSGWYSRLRKARTPIEIEGVSRRLIASLQVLTHFTLIPFTSPAIERYEAFKKLKLNIGGNDLRIAAIALEANATVVTANVRDFSRVPGLQVEDWSQP